MRNVTVQIQPDAMKQGDVFHAKGNVAGEAMMMECLQKKSENGITIVEVRVVVQVRAIESGLLLGEFGTPLRGGN